MLGLNIFLNFISWLFWPLIIIVLILFFVRRGKHSDFKQTERILQRKNWYLQVALCREDAVSQLFILLSFVFLGVTLLAFNRDFGSPVSWRLILLAISLLGFVGSYSFKTVYLLVFSLIGLTGWWGIQTVEWFKGKNIQAAGVFVGFSLLALCFYVLAHWHGKQIKFKRFSLVYLLLGLIPITGILFILSTQAGLGLLEQMTSGDSFFTSWQLTVSLALFLVALIGLTVGAVIGGVLAPFESLAVLVLTCLFGVLAFLPQQQVFPRSFDYYGYNMMTATGVLWAFIFNLGIFFELLWLIFSGYFRRESWLISLGAVFLFLLVIVKYFDWFFTFMDKSVFFISAGILLFVVGWSMEKGRRYIISSMAE